MELTCPKCHAAMRSYERNGVTVDQCTECRGIFLDRGELERLVDAEAAFHAPAAAPPAQGRSPQPPPQQPHPQHQGYQPGYGQRYDQGYGYPRKRQKSFLEQLFD